MTKIIDAFLFTHEHDLLEVRLRVLWDYVDKFILVEGDHNFTNQPKEMKFDKERFAWAKEKLVHIQHIGKFIDYTGELSVSGELFVENQHRQFLYETARTYGGPDDILMISDLDEIPSREVIGKLNPVAVTLLKQDFYYYNIHGHRGKRWDGTMAMKCGYDLGKMGDARIARNNMAFIDKECGWHLAHFFDSEGFREKLKHSSHQGYNTPEVYDKARLETCVKTNINYLGKSDGELPQEPMPEYLLAELRKFPIFVGEEWR